MSLRSTKNKLEADEPSPQLDVAFLSSFLVQFVVHPLASFGRPPPLFFIRFKHLRGSQQQDVPHPFTDWTMSSLRSLKQIRKMHLEYKIITSGAHFLLVGTIPIVFI